MLKAFGRLFLIAFCSLFFMFLVISMLRMLGTSQQYSGIEHPLLNQKKWAFAEVQNEAQVQNLNPKVSLFLKLYLSKDTEWIVAEKNFILSAEKKVQPLNSLTAEELSGYGVLTLDKILTASPGRPALLYIEDSSVRAFDKITALVKKHNLAEKVLIGSNYQIVLTEVRKLEPLWLYAASTSEISKLRFFTSIFIEPLATTNSDFVVFTDEPNERLVDELHKRKKRFIYRPKDGIPNAEISHKSDGLILKDTVILQQIVDQAPTEY
ncbi:MAG: hypothetical protein AABZ31_02425 [Bdellovibrionota bacterium]